MFKGVIQKKDSKTTTKNGSNNAQAFFTPLVVQKKLEIGAEDDYFEVEADHIADQVVAMPDSMPVHPPTNTPNNIQRKCAHCEDEERIQKKALASTSKHATPEVTSKIYSSKGSGSLMDTGAKDFMESRFGTDFSDVRIHTDSNASQLSQSLNAQAFTVGNDIYFNEGKYNPSSQEGKHLLAHELTHTLQQGDTIKTVHKKEEPTIQRNIFGDALRATGSALGSAAEFAWDNTGGVVIHYGGRAIQWVADKAEEIIDEIAPGLLDFLRNGWQSLKDMLAEALDDMTGGLFSRLQEEGLTGILGDFVDSIIASLTGKVTSACKSFSALAKKVFNFIEGLTGRALRRVKAAFDKISNGLSDLWNEFGKPAVRAVQSLASDVWTWVTDAAAWVWDLLEPIRNGISRAWNWIKERFDIAWNTGSSVLDWLTEKLTEAWEWIVSIIEPIKTPLMIIGVILLMLSPMGLFFAIGAAGYGIYQAVLWVKDNWDEDVFVEFRETIKETILDPIAEGIAELRNMVSEAFTWLGDAFDELAVQVTNLMEALGVIALFQKLKSALRSFGQMIKRAVVRVSEFIGGILAEIGEVLAAIWEVIRPFVVLVAKLVFLALNPWLWPTVISAWFWRILPDCFKPAIVNWVLSMMILVLSSMPDFKSFGETWAQVKEQMIQFLQEVLEKSDEEKITATNRVAEMISELDLELISNQIEALMQTPDHIESQMEEELLGMDLTQALPFESTSATNLVSQFESLGLSEMIPPEDAGLFSQQTYSDSDIEADAIGAFDPSPELITQMLTQMQGQDSFEFGNAPDTESRTVSSVLSEIVQSTGGSDVQSIGGGSGSEVADGEMPLEPMSHEEEIEFRLEQMMAQSDENMQTQACNPPEEIPQNDAPTAIPEHAKFGPLTRGQRARYMMGQMGSGMSKWWRCNRHWLIPSLIGVIIVLVVAEVLTDGLITAAFPIIFEALLPLMIGVAAVRSAYYIGQYVYKSIAGDIVGAAKSLARSLAVVAVELIFALLGSSVFWRSVSETASVMTSVAGRGARSFGRGIARVVPGSGRAARATVRGMERTGSAVLSSGRAAVSRGKLIMRGVGERIGPGIRSIEELSERLFRRVRFRRFRIRLIRRRFLLEGYINPWVPLANGDLAYFDQNQLRPARARSTVDEVVRLGDEVFVPSATGGTSTRRGIVIGSHGGDAMRSSGRTIVQSSDDVADASRFVREFEDLSQTRRMQEFRNMRGMSEAQRLRIIQNAQNTAALRRGISGAQPAFFQAHHIVPRQLLAEFDDFFRRIRFNIEDGLRNGIMIPPDNAVLQAALAADPSLASRFGSSALHLGSHPQYTDLIRQEIIRIISSGVDNATAASELNAVIARARGAISSSSGVHINDVVF
jgi:phage-related protein